MDVLFQLLVIFLVILIAYWWANQGLFSSILHFVATVCAGALALAFWEPLVVGVLLRNTFFDQYAWGVGLVALFGVSLLIIRVAFDKLAPANVKVPHWANLSFGGLLGIGSGIITVGILMIGMGMVQSADRFMGMKLVGRDRAGIGNSHDGDYEALWVPAHTWTVKFYEFLSAGSFRPDFEGVALRQVNPSIDEQAFSLMRDTFANGTSRITLPPESIRIVQVSESDSRVYVSFTVSNEAYDHARQFIMSSAQVRLIAHADGDVKRGDVCVAHPDRWTQLVAGTLESGSGSAQQSRSFIFDDPGHFMTSIPGQQASEFQIEFEKRNAAYKLKPGYQPTYLQVKGVRFELPRVDSVVGAARGLASETVTTDVPDDPSAPFDTTNQAIFASKDVRPLNTSINFIVGRVTHTNRHLVEGRMTVEKGRSRPSRENRVIGVYAMDGTAIVQVDVSRSSLASIYGPARDVAGETAAPVLVDSSGRVYHAKGYILDRPRDVEINLTPASLIRRASDLPHLPTNDTHKLRLFYEVTTGVTITSFRLGDSTVCRTNLLVRAEF